MPRSGPINVPIQLSVQFFQNGSLFDPFSVGPVRIFENAVGGTPLATLTPDSYQTGIFSVTWDALATSSSLQPGTYFDEWDWVAESGMATKTQRYSFALTAATTTTPTPPVTETAPVGTVVGCRPKPSWIRRMGLLRVDDLGNELGIMLAWEEARPADFNQQVHYNIYMSDTRFATLEQDPFAITTSLATVINVDEPGNVFYFAVKATEFDTDIDITEMDQIQTKKLRA